MFELSTALKYLIPRKKQLSVSLIALMSIGVISLVVWLVLVFLSVTEGIERNWLEKLTKLNAPLRITPTPAYYASYYYKIDELSRASNYQLKNIKEKALAALSDPYSPEEDGEIPFRFPEGEWDQNQKLKDPVKIAYHILSQLKEKQDGLLFQDYEVSGALMRLQILRPAGQRGESQNFLTQVSYVSSFPDKSPYATSLVLPPRAQDLNHLLFLSTHNLESSREDAPSLISSPPTEKASRSFKNLIDHALIQQIKTTENLWRIPRTLLPTSGTFQASGYFRDGHLMHVQIPVEPTHLVSSEKIQEGVLHLDEALSTFKTADGKTIPLPPHTPLFVEGILNLNAEVIDESVLTARQLKEIRLHVNGTLQGKPLKGDISWDRVEVTKAHIQTHFQMKGPMPLPWMTYDSFQAILPVGAHKETGVLLAKSFQDNGVMIGDPGYLSYTTTTLGSLQEQRLPIFVSGFYDPGVMSIGNKLILVPDSIAHTINLGSSSFILDKTQSNGISVWFSDLNAADQIKEHLSTAFQQAGIDAYWKISTFQEYDFAKDLLEQFQSDKYLFTLVGMIILIVACCNIISLLVLLVNDKKKEIGILQAMGASSSSIALIFGSCGIAMGVISSCIGTAAALFTLNHIDWIVYFLSQLQGHAAFNTAFYGNSLPSELTPHAVLFVLIATPIISLCAGLVPAIKACRLKPSEILRSE